MEGAICSSWQIGSTPKFPVLVDVAHYLADGRSSSAAKKAEALRRISLERLSSRFSFCRRFELGPLLGREPCPLAGVDLGLGHPGPQRLVADAELAGNATDHAMTLAGLLEGLEDHPDRPLLQLRRIPLLGSLVRWHDSILSKRWSLHNLQGGSESPRERLPEHDSPVPTELTHGYMDAVLANLCPGGGPAGKQLRGVFARRTGLCR